MGVLMNLRLIVVVLGLMVMLGAVGSYQNTEVQEDPGLSKPPSLEVHDVTGDHPTPVTDAILGSHFMENRGQLRDDEVLYYATTPGLHVAFHSNGLSYTLTEQVAENVPTSDDGPGNGWRLHLMFLGSQEVVPVPGSTVDASFNFFLGADKERWRTAVPAYEELRYPGLWEGIDLVYRLDEEGLKYDLEVQPGADLDRVRFLMEGQTGLSLDDRGALVIRTPLGDLTEEPPVARYMDGDEEMVRSGFLLCDDGAFGFEIGARDVSRPLLIDPLVYSGVMGSRWTGIAPSADIATDRRGCTYIVGGTQDVDFPVVPGGFQTVHAGWSDAYVAKISPDGSTMEFCTFLGGGSYEYGVGIDLDPEGNVYVAGYTQSDDFPLSPDAFDTTMEVEEVFVTKLSGDGDTLIYSTFLGGSGLESGAWIAVDGLGNAHITGWTNSTDFPTTRGASIPGEIRLCSFICKLNANGTDLVYSTYYSHSRYAWETHTIGIDLDPSGRAYIVGYATFRHFHYDEETFVLRVNTHDCGIEVLIYLDGNGLEMGRGIAVDRGRYLYITGTTSSDDLPATHTFSEDTTNWSDSSFVLKFNVIDDSVDYLVLLHGMTACDIAIDDNGSAYVSGMTYSQDYPATPGSYQPQLAGDEAGFLLKLSSDGSWIEYATFLGGSKTDYVQAIALDDDHNVHLTGDTNSNDFPVTPGAFNTVGPDIHRRDAFVCKFPNWHLRPPRAIAGPDQTVDQHQIVTLNGTRSTDDRAIISWSWTFFDEGQEVVLDGPLANHTFAVAGVYEVILNVSDDHGNWDTDNLTITVRDTTPPVVAVDGDTVVDQHETCVLNASGSLDNVGVMNWTWVFAVGDSSITQYGPTLNFTFDGAGTYEVVLTIEDVAGNQGTAFINVTVSDTTAPVAWAGLDIYVIQPDIVIFDSEGSSDNVGIVNWTWLFNYDGTEVRLHQERDRFRFDLAGVFNVTLMVHDAAGNAAWDPLTVTVQDSTPPVVDPGPDQVIDQHQIASFNGSGSTDNLGITNWTWTFHYDDRDTIIHSMTFNFWFAEAGVYQVHLTVRDASGNGAYDYCTVHVIDTTPPTADAGDDRMVDQGEQVIFDGYHSEDNVGVVEWQWSFDCEGELVTLVGEIQGFVFEHPGNYTVTLLVKDAAGFVASDTVKVDVRSTDGPITESEESTPVLLILTVTLVVLLFVVGVTLWRTRLALRGDRP